MMYMFDTSEEVTSCANCDLITYGHTTYCKLDEDISCTMEHEGLPIGCPLMKVTKERVEAYGIR